jgi:hypothetical protein
MNIPAAGMLIPSRSDASAPLCAMEMLFKISDAAVGTQTQETSISAAFVLLPYGTEIVV